MINKDNLFESGVTGYETLPRGEQKGLPKWLRRIQIQMALVIIGNRLGYTTCLAGDGARIISDGQTLSEAEAAAEGLRQQSPIVDCGWAALLAGCVWFRNPRLVPAVIEVGDTQIAADNLRRMGEFQSLVPTLPIRWVIAAPDEDRQKVIQEASKDVFKPLNARFFPHSAIEELCSLCVRRNIPAGSVNEAFLDSYMECCLTRKP